MHYEIRFAKARPLVEVRLYGRADIAAFAELDMELVDHPDWTPGTDMLFDFRQLDMSHLQMSDVRESSLFVRTLSERFGKGRLACVMGTTVDYGLARAWELMTENDVSLQIKIFRSADEAWAWVDS